jgi:4-carboxymuconolactone decarboxylase
MTARITADLTTIRNADQITITPTRGAPTMTDTTDTEPSGAPRMFGDFALGLVGFTDDVLFGQVWTRPDLSPKERSLVTVACLTTSNNTDQLVVHLDVARRNGNTEAELIERSPTSRSTQAGPRRWPPWPSPNRSSPPHLTHVADLEREPAMRGHQRSPCRGRITRSWLSEPADVPVPLADIHRPALVRAP